MQEVSGVGGYRKVKKSHKLQRAGFITEGVIKMDKMKCLISWHFRAGNRGQAEKYMIEFLDFEHEHPIFAFTGEIKRKLQMRECL